MATAAAEPASEGFYGLVRDYLAGLPAAAKFAAALARVDGTCTTTIPPRAAPAGVSAVAWQHLASPASAPLVAAFVAGMARLAWTDPIDADYAARSGLAAGSATTVEVGPAAAVPTAQLACGFFHVGPGVDYCDHQHRPEELYLPIAGMARFWSEGNGWRDAGADAVMVHGPWQWHAMRTAGQPVLILWMWLGPDGLADTPQLRPGLGDAAA